MRECGCSSMKGSAWVSNWGSHCPSPSFCHTRRASCCSPSSLQFPFPNSLFPFPFPFPLRSLPFPSPTFSLNSRPLLLLVPLPADISSLFGEYVSAPLAQLFLSLFFYTFYYQFYSLCFFLPPYFSTFSSSLHTPLSLSTPTFHPLYHCFLPSNSPCSMSCTCHDPCTLSHQLIKLLHHSPFSPFTPILNQYPARSSFSSTPMHAPTLFPTLISL